MNPTIEIQAARVLKVPKSKRRTYRMAVTFTDGTRGTADFASVVKREPFTPLSDPKMFAKARVENGAIEWPCDVGIAPEAVYALAHHLPRPTTGGQARANELEMSLRELRRVAGKQQTEVAALLRLTQGAVSHLEREDDHKLSTLRKYVASLGGQLEVVAVLGDKRIALRGV